MMNIASVIKTVWLGLEYHIVQWWFAIVDADIV